MAKDTDATRSKIIDYSAKYFSRYGLRKTTIDEIAASLRMGKSSLYYYFRNKEEIYRAVLEKEIETLSARVREDVEKAASPQEKLRTFVVQRMKYLKELVNIYSALKDDYLTNYGFIQELRADYDRRETAFMQDILKDGAARGVFAVVDLELTARTLITALKGLEYEWSVKAGTAEMERNIDTLLNVLMNGIRKKS